MVMPDVVLPLAEVKKRLSEIDDDPCHANTR
jgi:hypothetical protein